MTTLLVLLFFVFGPHVSIGWVIALAFAIVFSWKSDEA